jgi:hypothetical protein
VQEGRIPQLIRDAAEVPEVTTLACTREMPNGAHISVLIRFSDSSV